LLFQSFFQIRELFETTNDEPCPDMLRSTATHPCPARLYAERTV
jgi:hypothetical protein